MTEQDKEIQELRLLIDKLSNEITELKLEIFRLMTEQSENEESIRESRDISDFMGE